MQMLQWIANPLCSLKPAWLSQKIKDCKYCKAPTRPQKTTLCFCICVGSLFFMYLLKKARAGAGFRLQRLFATHCKVCS